MEGVEVSGITEEEDTDGNLWDYPQQAVVNHSGQRYRAGTGLRARNCEPISHASEVDV